MLRASLSTGPLVSGSMGSSGVLQSQAACFRHSHSPSTHHPSGEHLPMLHLNHPIPHLNSSSCERTLPVSTGS